MALCSVANSVLNSSWNHAYIVQVNRSVYSLMILLLKMSLRINSQSEPGDCSPADPVDSPTQTCRLSGLRWHVLVKVSLRPPSLWSTCTRESSTLPSSGKAAVPRTEGGHSKKAKWCSCWLSPHHLSCFKSLCTKHRVSVFDSNVLCLYPSL